MTRAPVQSPYILVGFSVGALWERLYAAHYPEGIAGMIIIDQAFFPSNRLAGAHQAQAPTSAPRMSGPLLITQAPLVFGFEDDQSFDRLPRVDQELHKWALAQHPVRPDQEMAADCLTQIDRATRNQSYPLHEIPLVVVRTENQSPGYAEMQAKLLKLSRQSRQVVAWNSSHMVPIDQPEMIVSAIKTLVGTAPPH